MHALYLLILALILPFTSMAFEPTPVTPFPVLGYQQQSFFDDLQKTKRTLLAWYPIDAGNPGVDSDSPWDVFKVAINAPPKTNTSKMPVVVLSHGYLGNPHQLSWLILGLVHHGFIVISIQHRDLIDGKVHANHWQRANDVKLMIDQFLKSPLAAISQLDHIGIAGFSLGGTTSLWVSGGRTTKLDSLIPSADFASPDEFIHADEALPTINKELMAKEWQDLRVKAAFIMAPAWAWLFDEESLKKITIPTYIIASAADKVLVTRNNAEWFAKRIPHSIYQAIPGNGNHYIFISMLNDPKKKKADPKGELNFLFDEDTDVDRQWIQQQVCEEAVRFFISSFSQ